jgi:PAS domain S-box-containing protein
MSRVAAVPSRVLYVDDDPDVRQIAGMALSLNEQIHVETCSSGEEALAILPKLMPDLVVLDVMMPGLDGPTTLARIRANPMYAHIPVAFMTAKALPREVERFMELGAIGVIGKPFDPMRLADDVSSLWRSAAPPAAKAVVSEPLLDTAPAAAVDLSIAGRASHLEWLLQSVLEVQRLINEADFDLEVFMRRVVDVAQRLTNAKGAVVELVDGDEMAYRCASASVSQHVGLRLRRQGSLSGQCIDEGRALRCDDALHDDRVDKEACQRVGVRSMVCTPLVQDGRAVGVLKVFNAEPHAFDADDEYLLNFLGGALGAALGRQIAIEALRASEETFRLAMENASIGMALVTPAGQFMKVNAALCELLGYSEAELLNADFQSITHPADLERDLHLVLQVLSGEINRYRMEKRYFHKSGRIVWVLLSVSLVRDTAGKPSYFVSQIQDISEQREMERVKSEFISTVSHELRTPLTSIRGSLGLVLGAMTDKLPAQVRNLLDIAQSNSDRLILLINDILDIDKIATGGMRFDLQSHSLAEITAAAVRDNEAYARKFGARIQLEPVDANLAIRVDQDRYVQVLSNLLSNAAKFSPTGEEITVRVRAAGRIARVSVIDRGPGIPEDFQARIFEKFSQLDSSAARNTGGTGLGLHIARELVEHMGGRIGFRSTAGAGSTFWVEFPLVSPESP